MSLKDEVVNVELTMFELGTFNYIHSCLSAGNMREVATELLGMDQVIPGSSKAYESALIKMTDIMVSKMPPEVRSAYEKEVEGL